MTHDDPGVHLEGGCTCGTVRYRLSSEPLFVHCCHCRWCQRETGAAFAINALIEAMHTETLRGSPELVHTPSESGKGQNIARCPDCRVAVWSNYSGLGDVLNFIRVGTLDNPDRLQPDIHIYTMSKQPWVILPSAVPILHGYYDRREYWPAESLERLRRLRAATP